MTTVLAMVAVKPLVRREVFVSYLAFGLIGATLRGMVTAAILG